MRVLFSIIGYVSTGTVLALAIGLGLLWQSEMLTDDKMFRMAAVLHDVDLEAIEAEQQPTIQNIPEEETSIADVERMREVKMRNFEVKQNALKMSRQEFDHSLRQISEATARFDKHASELEDRLKDQGELTLNENMVEVVNNLQGLKPNEAKEQLLMFMEEGKQGEKDVIRLLKAMQNSKRQKILQQFTTPGDREKLHRIQRLMLEGFPEKPEIDAMLEQVRKPNSGA